MSRKGKHYPKPRPEVLKAINNNVEVVKTVLADQLNTRLDLNERSIKRIAAYINLHREKMDKEKKTKLINVFGAFLGEAIIRNYGGEWVINRGVLGILLSDETFTFPFQKVSRQMHNGPDDSIYNFYQIVPMIADGSIVKNPGKLVDGAEGDMF